METNTNEVVWCMSADGEYFYETECATFDECITEGLRQFRQAKRGKDTDFFPAFSDLDIETAEFFIGTKQEFVPRIDAEDVIERLQVDAYDQCGELAEDYLSHASKDDVAVLQNLLQCAFKRWEKSLHMEPSFFVVHEVSSIRIADHKERLAALCVSFGSSGTATERLCSDSARDNAPELREATHTA